MYLLEECGHYDFEDTQCGFGQGRGTNIPISLTQDVIIYNVKGCNPVFACSLDVEDSCDPIPFGILFHKAAGVLSEGS